MNLLVVISTGDQSEHMFSNIFDCVHGIRDGLLQVIVTLEPLDLAR